MIEHLNITQKTLRMRLNNQYTDKEFYFENVDYIKEKYGVKYNVKYLLNYQCFERINIEDKIINKYFIKSKNINIIRKNKYIN